MKYWLFSGVAPSSAAEARARTLAEHPPALSVGGSLASAPAQFHDVGPGTYAACAGIFDAKTMDAMDSPFGCTQLVVHDEPVLELAIALQP
ncbi:MAG: hypothetical protein NT062_24565 [Proteobacteria bacterium]|nr:hypothetical protein [Pseudomonadota bacterium]